MIEFQSFCNISSSFSINIIVSQAKYDERERERERKREITYSSLVKVWLSFRASAIYLAPSSPIWLLYKLNMMREREREEGERDYLL